MTSRLSSLLVQDGLVSAKRMADAFQRQVIYGGTLDTNLLEMRVVEEDLLLNYLGRAAALPTQPAGIAAMGPVNPSVLLQFTQEVAERYRAVPGRPEAETLQVLVADPVEPQTMEELAQLLHMRVEPWIAPEFRLIEAMEAVFGVPVPPRFQRLILRSRQAHEGKGLPAPRLIDPIPRFGTIHTLEAATGSNPPQSKEPEARAQAPNIEHLIQIPSPSRGHEATLTSTEFHPSVSAALENQVSSLHPGEPHLVEQTISSSPNVESVPSTQSGHSSARTMPSLETIAPPPPSPSTATISAILAPDEPGMVETAPQKPEPVQYPRPSDPVPPPLAERSEPASKTAAPPLAGSVSNWKKKKKQRGAAAVKEHTSHGIPSPVIIPPAKTQAAKEIDDRHPQTSSQASAVSGTTIAEPPRELPTVIQPSIVVAELHLENVAGTQSSSGSARAENASAEHTPLPSPMPPLPEFSTPNESFISGLQTVPGLQTPSSQAEPSSGREFSAPIPVPIDSGRLGEQIFHADQKEQTRRSTSTPPAAHREAQRAAAAYGEKIDPLSYEDAYRLIGKAEERDVIFESLCRSVRSHMAFAAVFTVHGDVAFGRIALGERWLDRQALSKIAIPLDRPSAFRIAAKGRSPYLGRLGEQPAAGDPLTSLGRTPPLPGLVIPILVRGRPVALLYVDAGGQELKHTIIDELRPLIAEVSQAFQRLVVKSRAGGLGAAVDPGRRVQDEMITPHTSAIREPQTSRPPKVVDVGTKVEADVATPRESTETPTTKLRPDPSRRNPADPRSIAVDNDHGAVTVSPKLEPKQGNVVAPVLPRDGKVKVEPPPPPKISGAVSKIDGGKAPPVLPIPPKQKGDSKQSELRSAKSETRPSEPVRGTDIRTPLEQKRTTPPYGELCSKIASGDERAADLLISGGVDAAQAVVASLPGPLKNTKRQAMGEAQSEAVYARGPLLGLVPRMGKAIIGPLLARLQEPSLSAEDRYYLVLCLGELPAPETLRVLQERVFDLDDAVRMAALTALRSHPSASIQAVLDILRSELDSDDGRRQSAAVEALGEMRDKESIPRLVSLLDHRDPLLRGAAERALQTITKQDFGLSKFRWMWWWRKHGQEVRLQWVLSALGHSDETIRAAAQDELLTISGDVAGYRFNQPKRQREDSQRRWISWWQRRGYPVSLSP